ncbi:MAG TPA: cytochrome c [Blastocatellia bacterium]|nr:cytochrome c [Blastocatellia bacterium]
MKRKLYLVATAALLLLSASLNISGNGSGRSGAAVTFTKDVAPIIYENCAGCHRPGEIAPMSLLTYRQARPWAKSIREKVLDRSMPPWHADPAHGRFKNDRSLSKKEIDTIVKWVDTGAKEGNPKDLPPLPAFHEGWRMGKPDVVLTMDREFEVQAEGAVSYQYFYIPTNFKEDRWVQAAEVRPGNPSVVHHVIVFVVGPDVISRRGLMRDNVSGLVGTAPGEEPMVLPDGVGRKVKAGSTLVLQMHYTPNGTPQKDRTSVGLIFSRKPVEKEMVGGVAMNRRFTIPAGAESHEVRSSYSFKEDARIMSLMPHMHLRGKDYQFKLIYPDGASKILLSVPRYDFNWQTRYELAEPVFAPKGSRVECVAHFDNSPKNKWNPDPTKEIRWGQQTWDEMMIGFIGFVREDEKVSASAPASR